ncbi:MAG TPA: HD domain-containing protein [Caldisericia bacterium]|nr:HD domain-containing protein [Caldisericia bacterium]HPF49061.1 HD domain-containing protein [Caldisericia bacterium]HPI83075.1 HD domain-containing protein [Caldisericia bacterium]HPQ92302.1 HD domain-containing protein [Caldisericia bacterium]HRV74600.1 HD domain-containing protein [Caldisericia bacterium]
MTDASSIIAKLLVATETLTEVLRAGYVLKGVADPEKVSSHSFNVAVLVLLISEQVGRLDTAKCIKMALIHDISEALVMDTPLIAKKYFDKNGAENIASAELFADFPELLELLNEYHDSKTDESKLVHDCDTLQMLVRASRYNRFGQGDMAEFMDTVPVFHFDICHKVLKDFRNLDGKIYIK